MKEESWESTWNGFFTKSDGNQYPETCIVRFVARNFYSHPDRASVNILDLGCGTGVYSWYLAREGFRAYGIDGSEAAISKAKAKFVKEGLSADFRVGDIVSLPYEDGIMDAVIDGTAIQHNSYEAIKKIVSEVYRVLRSGGKFFGMMIAFETTRNSFLKTHYLKKDEVRSLFTKFKDLKVGYLEYSEDSNNKDYKFWLVQCEKP